MYVSLENAVSLKRSVYFRCVHARKKENMRAALKNNVGLDNLL